MSTPEPARAPTGPTQTDPFSPGLQRLAAVTGIGFALLLLVAILVAGDDSPDFDAPLTEWTTYAQDNEDNVRISALIMGIAAFEFIWFAGYVRSVLGEAEVAARGFARLSYIVFAGAIVGISGLALGLFLSAGALSHPDDTPPEVIRGLSQLSGPAFGLASVGFGAMLYTAFFLNQRLRTLPSWLSWLSLITGLCFLLQLGVLLSDDNDNVFGVFYPLGFLGLIIWSIATSVIFVRRVGRER